MFSDFEIAFKVAPVDYGAVSTILMFDSCETQSCTNISIVNDLALENVESFNVFLERTTGLDSRIRLSPVNGEIAIDDDDGVYDIELYR